MQSLLRLLPYYRQYRRTLWRGLGLLLFARVFEAIIPQLLRRGIDGIPTGAAPLAFLAAGIFATHRTGEVGASTLREGVADAPRASGNGPMS